MLIVGPVSKNTFTGGYIMFADLCLFLFAFINLYGRFVLFFDFDLFVEQLSILLKSKLFIIIDFDFDFLFGHK